MSKPNSPLSQFIEEYPLYSKFGIDQPIEAADLNNLVFNFFCKEEKETQPFRLISTVHNGVDHASAINGTRNNSLERQEGARIEFTELFTGICQSCERYKVSIIINGASQNDKPAYFIRKIGQYPAPESSMVKMPADMAGFLSKESSEFYSRALRNLELEYGTGALTYFRRMLNAGLERIIEGLANPYLSGSNTIAEAFACYKKDNQKTKFIEEITPHLPKSLQEHGANVLVVLQDALSNSMDDLTEAECIKKSRDIDSLLRYIIRKILTDVNDASRRQPPGKYFLRYS